MICEFRNILEKYTFWCIIGDTSASEIKCETDLVDVLAYLFTAIFITITFVWWLVPLRLMLNKLFQIKFKCNKI